MRMLDNRYEVDSAPSRKPVTDVATRLLLAAGRVLRAWGNRNALNRLNDLDERLLLDIGLRRQEVSEAMNAPFLADTGLHLTIAARERARRHLRSGRLD